MENFQFLFIKLLKDKLNWNFQLLIRETKSWNITYNFPRGKWLVGVGHPDRQTDRSTDPGGRGVLPEYFLGGGVPHGSQNPDPISHQNIWFFRPLFRPDPENLYPFSDLNPKIYTPFQTSVSRDWLPFAQCTTWSGLNVPGRCQNNKRNKWTCSLSKSYPIPD